LEGQSKEGEMAFCPNCGAKIGDNDKFCGSCGATRAPGTSAGQTEPLPPPVAYQAPAQPQSAPPAYNGSTGGYQQPINGSQPNTAESSTGLKPNIAGLLCYLFGWITGIIFLVVEKKSQFVRFHAAQSIVVFGALSILGIILNFIPYIGFLSAIVGLLGFILWLFLIYKAYQGESYKLPIAGDIASGIAGKV
jgi:uncharacterized membrane protein